MRREKQKKKQTQKTKTAPEGAVLVMFGRHDWTRTNDPYHVKVVL
jgi:hypothetical protein